MAKRKPTGQVSAVAEHQSKPLTWQEERFVEEFIENGGNATAAYRIAYPNCTRGTANTDGPRLLVRPGVREAIEGERDRIRKELRFDRDKAARVLVAIALTSPDEVMDVLRTPNQRESYEGLGIKRKAIHVQKTPDGYVASTPTASERRAAINDLREMLGLDKEKGSGNWLDGLGELFGAIDRVKESRGK